MNCNFLKKSARHESERIFCLHLHARAKKQCGICKKTWHVLYFFASDANIACTGAKIACAKVQRNSAKKEKKLSTKEGEKNKILSFSTNHSQNNRARFTKKKFLVEISRKTNAFGTAIASILVKTLHSLKVVGNFFGYIVRGRATKCTMLRK